MARGAFPARRALNGRRAGQDGPVRFGTWNLAGRWSPAHRALLEDAGCDVWLLTEVPARFDLPHGRLLRSEAMPNTGGRSWAGVWSAGTLAGLEARHPAAAAAVVGGVVVCSCVLPWRGAGATWPDAGTNTAGRTTAALERLRPGVMPGAREVVWGGDWNHAMSGPEMGGSKEGRRAIQALARDGGLRVATATQRHAIPELLSIDHIAVPEAWTTACRRIVAEHRGKRLSDHDAYVIHARRG